jgi:hypothetical protein
MPAGRQHNSPFAQLSFKVLKMLKVLNVKKGERLGSP